MPHRFFCVMTLFCTLALCIGGCTTASSSPSSPTNQEASMPQAPLGKVTRLEVLSASEAWREALTSAQEPVNLDAASKLAVAPPGARLEVYLGIWCSDSRRGLVQFWRAVDSQGGLGKMPFTVELISLDREFSAPGFRKGDASLVAVPTFVIWRDGREVGRLVETPERSIEEDLVALLYGEKRGVVSGSR